MNKFLDAVALRITNGVGTMYCALIFTGIALVSLPDTLASGNPVQIVGWIAQTFLQLVLLSVIMVGQRLQAAKTEQLIQEMHDAVLVELASINEIHAALLPIHEALLEDAQA